MNWNKGMQIIQRLSCVLASKPQWCFGGHPKKKAVYSQLHSDQKSLLWALLVLQPAWCLQQEIRQEFRLQVITAEDVYSDKKDFSSSSFCFLIHSQTLILWQVGIPIATLFKQEKLAKGKGHYLNTWLLTSTAKLLPNTQEQLLFKLGQKVKTLQRWKSNVKILPFRSCKFLVCSHCLQIHTSLNTCAS